MSPVVFSCPKHGLIARRPCGQCQRERNRRPQMRLWTSPAWRRVRKLALARDGYRCVECGCNDEILTVHHIEPFMEGGAFLDLDNLETLCRICHGAIDGRRSHGEGGTSIEANRRTTALQSISLPDSRPERAEPENPLYVS